MMAKDRKKERKERRKKEGRKKERKANKDAYFGIFKHLASWYNIFMFYEYMYNI
jgi:hypothetical protein